MKNKFSLLLAAAILISVCVISGFGFSVTAEGETGFCAVGEVDTGAGEAAILLSTGEVKTVEYTGTEPIAGELYIYTAVQNEQYSFYRAEMIPGYTTESAAWDARAFTDQSFYFGAQKILDSDSVIFARYSATEWRVFKGLSIKSDNLLTKAYFRLKANPAQGGSDIITLGLIGDYNTTSGTITAATADQTAFLDVNGAGWTTGDKTVTIESGNIPPVVATGFCAVGEVQSTLNKAAVLFDNGTIETVPYSGTAPVSGEVNYFTKDANGVFAFTRVVMFPGYGSDYSSWAFGTYAASKNIYYGGAYSLTNDSAFFVRYSATEWRVFKGIDMIQSDQLSKGYIYVDGGNLLFGMIVGECGAEDNLLPANEETTKFLDTNGVGWNSGDKTVTVSDVTLPPAQETGNGFCAVGEVNTTDNRAVILLGSGEIKTIEYQGTAPVSGELYIYTSYDNGKYSFYKAEMLPGYSKESASWDARAFLNQKFYCGGEKELTDDSIIFVRYSETEWRVFKGKSIKIDSALTKMYMRLMANPVEGGNDIITIALIGDFDTDSQKIIPVTKTNTKFLDEAGAGWSYGDKMLTFAPSQPSIDTSVVTKTGYCAVGNVNKTEKVASILMGDGRIVLAQFKEDAPVSGDVHEFKLYSDGKYTFTQLSMLPGMSVGNPAWDLRAFDNNTIYFANQENALTNDSIIFVRYSETEWRVFKGLSIKQNNVLSKGYFLIKDAADGKKQIVVGLIGGYDDTQKKIIPATKEMTSFLDANAVGWGTGNKFLVANPDTADNFSPISSVLVVFSAVMLIGVISVRRLKLKK